MKVTFDGLDGSAANPAMATRLYRIEVTARAGEGVEADDGSPPLVSPKAVDLALRLATRAENGPRPTRRAEEAVDVPGEAAAHRRPARAPRGPAEGYAMTELRGELAEWAIARREIERRGDLLLFRAQQEMGFADVLAALNDEVAFDDDEYRRQELEEMLLALRSRLERYARMAGSRPRKTSTGPAPPSKRGPSNSDGRSDARAVPALWAHARLSRRLSLLERRARGPSPVRRVQDPHDLLAARRSGVRGDTAACARSARGGAAVRALRCGRHGAPPLGARLPLP